MERDIKPTYDELESYVENLQKQLADAQATIAALRQELKVTGNYAGGEAEQIAALQAERDEYKTMYACLTGETYDNPIADLKAQLTQRTAELEAVNEKVQFLEKKNSNLLDSSNTVLKVKADQDVRLADLQAELERVRDQYADLSKLIKALPKVEGEIVAKAGYLKDKDRVYALFASDEVMNAHLALWEHRQGMEG